MQTHHLVETWYHYSE